MIHKSPDCPPLTEVNLDKDYVSQGRKLNPI
jgi:hypothetical protein